MKNKLDLNEYFQSISLTPSENVLPRYSSIITKNNVLKSKISFYAVNQFIPSTLGDTNEFRENFGGKGQIHAKIVPLGTLYLIDRRSENAKRESA